MRAEDNRLFENAMLTRQVAFLECTVNKLLDIILEHYKENENNE